MIQFHRICSMHVMTVDFVTLLHLLDNYLPRRHMIFYFLTNTVIDLVSGVGMLLFLNTTVYNFHLLL